MSNKGTIVLTLFISALGAGAGALGWLELLYEEPLATAVPIAQDDFDSPVFLPFTLPRAATLTVQATASRLVHNPEAGEGGWLYTGLHLTVWVDGKVCARNHPPPPERKIVDGRELMQLDAACDPMKIGPGQHFIRIEAVPIGSCKENPQSPATCNTNRIRGAYTLVE